MDNVISTYHMQEKKEGRGEDSDPIRYEDDNSVVIGVFDGMGGAGGAECESDFTHDGIKKTKAYVASRIIRNAIDEAINNNPELLFSPNLPLDIKKIIEDRYAIETKNHPPKSKAGLRSSLIKEYPTTLAISCITQTERDYTVKSLWAGDSRNYLWTKEGLRQISKDDLKIDLDPMQNLREDAPVSNCIQADAPFTINEKEIPLNGQEKFVVISATDGCFGYYPSPMDFEKTLIDALNESNSIDAFKKYLTYEFAVVTADDFSFAIAAIGFKDFEDIKKVLGIPSPLVKQYFNKRRHLDKEVKKAERKLANLKNKANKKMRELWPVYKKNYLKHMNDNERR